MEGSGGIINKANKEATFIGLSRHLPPPRICEEGKQAGW
jgi:hypothetical protein